MRAGAGAGPDGMGAPAGGGRRAGAADSIRRQTGGFAELPVHSALHPRARQEGSAGQERWTGVLARDGT